MRCPWAVEGRSSFAISSPSRVGKGRGDGPPWECTTERVNRCGGNNPQSWLAPLTAPQFTKAARIRTILSPLRGQLLCQRSLLVSALSNAIRIRNPLEFTTPKRPLSERGWHGVSRDGGLPYSSDASADGGLPYRDAAPQSKLSLTTFGSGEGVSTFPLPQVLFLRPLRRPFRALLPRTRGKRLSPPSGRRCPPPSERPSHGRPGGG